MKKAGPPRNVGRGGSSRPPGRPTGRGGKKTVASSTTKKEATAKEKKTTEAAGKNEETKKKVVWTEKDDKARKIQTCYRAYCCRKLLRCMQKKKAEYDAMMDKLQREAYVQMVRMEQQRAEAERKREEEERKKRREQAKRKSRILEAAFDGNITEVNSVLNEVSQLCKDQGDGVAMRSQHKLVECTDANGNSPLSEAAAGGDLETISLFLSLEANPNRKGQYGRTPLYRAAFAGHVDAVKVLLEGGADPRISADDGERPDQVTSNPKVESALKDWNIEDTEHLLRKLDDAETQRIAVHQKLYDTIENRLKKIADDAEKEYSAKQKELLKAHEELNKRIYEHDKNMATAAIKTEITLAIVHDAEAQQESARMAAEEARKKLSDARLQLRLKRKEFIEDVKMDDDNDDKSADVSINIRELDDVLMKDVGNKISDSGRWPLIVDPGKQATTFLRYRDTNYINCCNPRQMEPEIIRLALLGAIRYGKFFVLDLMDIDGLWAGVEQRMDLVQKNLLQNLMNMSLIKENKYQSLCRETDGEEYSPKSFLSARVHDFKLVVVTQLNSLPKPLTEQFYIISIHVTQPR